MNKIYTFWHDSENMPDYIKLCIETWRKNLPEFEIIILNYDNYEQYIGKNFYDKSLFENFTIAQQTQAIRAAVLERHGGFWFDADVVVTSADVLKLFDDQAELNIFSHRIACMKAKKGSKILKKWIRGIKWNIWKYKYLFNFMFEHFPYTASDMMNWGYLSDNILKKLFKCKNKKILNNIDIYKSKVYPELCWLKENPKFKDYQMVDIYNHFYIKNNFYDNLSQNDNGLIILHNSWMPREYKTLSAEKIFAKNNTIAEVLKNINN